MQSRKHFLEYTATGPHETETVRRLTDKDT